jgi:hypothetical protein
MHYGGFKHIVDSGKLRLPEWVQHLDWADQNTLPQPLREITQDKWFKLGICGHESEGEVFYQGLQIPGEYHRPLGGWACHIRMYYTYALVDAHVYGHPHPVGTFVPGHGAFGYTIRYFQLGCVHTWREIQEESRMCYHVYVCNLCGMRRSIDSSD